MITVIESRLKYNLSDPSFCWTKEVIEANKDLTQESDCNITRGAQGGGGYPKPPPRIEKSGKTPPPRIEVEDPPPKPPSEARRLIFRVF